MSDLTYRTPIEPVLEESLQKAKESSLAAEVQIEGPYTDYELQHTHPYAVDHFELGNYWNTDEAYTKDVQTVEDFIRSKIMDKTIGNSLDSVKDYLREIESVNEIKSYTPITTKLAKILEYIQTMKD